MIIEFEQYRVMEKALINIIYNTNSRHLPNALKRHPCYMACFLHKEKSLLK